MPKASIIGDSISTFEGYNPSGYSVFYTKSEQIRNGLSSVEDTWWYQVLNAFNLELCINDSYSGSRVSGYLFPAANSMERILNLKTNTSEPNIILIYIGFNDFGYGVPIHNPIKKEKDLYYFEDAYEQMLEELKKQYPSTLIICATILKTTMKDHPEWELPTIIDSYNETIRIVTNKQKCFLADIAKDDVKYEALDGVHPTKEGHKTIAEAWIKSLKTIITTEKVTSKLTLQ